MSFQRTLKVTGGELGDRRTDRCKNETLVTLANMPEH